MSRGARSLGTIIAAFVVCAGSLLSPTAVNAADPVPSIVLSRSVGPPTRRSRVSGSGFAPSEAIDVDFDVRAIALSSPTQREHFAGTFTFLATLSRGTMRSPPSVVRAESEPSRDSWCEPTGPSSTRPPTEQE